MGILEGEIWGATESGYSWHSCSLQMEQYSIDCRKECLVSLHSSWPATACVGPQIQVQPHDCLVCAQVCVEAGMLALRRDGLEVNHEDFNEGIVAVQAKKKAKLSYYA